MSKKLFAILAGTTSAAAVRMTDFSIDTSGMTPVLQSADFSEASFQALEIANGKDTAILAMTEIGLLAIDLSKKKAKFKSAALIDLLAGTISKLNIGEHTLSSKKAKAIAISGAVKELIAATFPVNAKAEDDQNMDDISIDGKTTMFTPSMVIAKVLAIDKAGQYQSIASILTASKDGTLPGYDVSKSNDDVRTTAAHTDPAGAQEAIPAE